MHARAYSSSVPRWDRLHTPLVQLATRAPVRDTTPDTAPEPTLRCEDLSPVCVRGMERGLSIDSRTASRAKAAAPLSRRDIDAADVLVPLTRAHRAVLLAAHPAAAAKTRALLSFGGDDADVHVAAVGCPWP